MCAQSVNSRAQSEATDDVGLPPSLSQGMNRRSLFRLGAVAGLGVVGAGSLSLPAIAANSGNGWPGIKSSGDSRLDRGFKAAGVAFPGGVRRGEVSTILGYVAATFHRNVEPLRPGWCWGWNYRPIRGGSSLSNHASATAIDINAPRHPIGKSGTFSSAQVRQIRVILATCEGTVRWGGDYSNRPDEMHFEINRRPGDPAIARVVKKLGGGSNPPPAPSPWPTLKLGSKGFRVTSLQHLLKGRGHKISADGIFGKKTEAAVKSFQRSKGLKQDGLAGPKTWGAVVVTVSRKNRSNTEAVRGAQTALKARGYKIAVDGRFGPGTQNAVVSFQGRSKLKKDGIVGPNTWAALV